MLLPEEAQDATMLRFSASPSFRIPRAARMFSVLVALGGVLFALLIFEGRMRASQPDSQKPGLLGQTQSEVDRKNTGCVSCHTTTDEPSMHPTRTVRLACIDCHGGDATAIAPVGVTTSSAGYEG